MPILLFFILLFTAPASAASLEGPMAEPQLQVMLLQDASEEADAPQLSDAYSSLYLTKQERRSHESKALAMGLLGGLAGYLAAAIGAFVTAGIGLIALPVAVAVGAAYGVQPFFDARLVWEIVGAAIGLATGAVLAWSAGFFAGIARGTGLATSSILFGVVVLSIGPGVGAWIAGITDQDNLEKRRLELLVGAMRLDDQHNGLGLTVRF